MFVLTATIRPGLHGTFTLEFLTVDMTEPTVFTGFISVEEAQLKMVELFANANVDVSKVKQKPVKYFTTKTRYGTVEIWMRANGKKKYLKVVENETQAQLFIKGKAVVEQSINVDLQRNVTQLQQENERLRLELENVLNKIPQKRSVNHGDLLATQTFGVCPKCQEPFVVRHLPSGLPFKVVVPTNEVLKVLVRVRKHSQKTNVVDLSLTKRRFRWSSKIRRGARSSQRTPYRTLSPSTLIGMFGGNYVKGEMK